MVGVVSDALGLVLFLQFFPRRPLQQQVCLACNWLTVLSGLQGGLLQSGFILLGGLLLWAFRTEQSDGYGMIY